MDLQSYRLILGVIYILRSLMPPSEIFKVIQRGYPFRFIVHSTGSLVIGLLHLNGVLGT